MEIETKTIVRLSVCDFFDFLEKNNALLSYRENLLKCTDDPFLIFRNYTPPLWLAGFVWENTKEGIEFWKDLDRKWDEYIQYDLYKNRLENVFWEVDNSEELITKNFVDLHTGLIGKWYRVIDNSFNRSAVEGEPYKWTHTHESWLPLANGEEYLILSDTPEMKEITCPGVFTDCCKFIKVWVPGKNQVQYVLFCANGVTDKPNNPAKK